MLRCTGFHSILRTFEPDAGVLGDDNFPSRRHIIALHQELEFLNAFVMKEFQKKSLNVWDSKIASYEML